MPSTTHKALREVRVLSFNIAKNYKDLDVLFERECNNFHLSHPAHSTLSRTKLAKLSDLKSGELQLSWSGSAVAQLL